MLNDSFTLEDEMMKSNKYIAIIISILELLLFLVFIFYRFLNITILHYFYKFVLIPNFLIFGNLILGNILLKSKPYSTKYKIYIPIIMLFIFIFILNVLHVKLPLEFVFLFPIFQTIIFGELNISKKITIVSIILATISYLFNNLFSLNIFKFSYLIVFNIIFVIAFYTVKFLISYSSSVENNLYDSLNKQILLKRQLEIDQLSGLFNHSYLFNKLNTSIKEKQKMCLAVIDIDFFKKVNDNYGHESGNVVIKKLGETMLKHSESNIIPTRYGGEEFAIVFLNKSEKETFELMEDIRKDFSSIEFKELDNNIVTFSCGIASYPGDISSEDFFTLADEAMYFAKDTGRNKTILKSEINKN